MDSGSTPGNSYISAGEGLDIFQRVPYNIPIIGRSTIFQRGQSGTRREHKIEWMKTIGIRIEKYKKVMESSDGFGAEKV